MQGSISRLVRIARNRDKAFQIIQCRNARVLATDNVDQLCVDIFKQRGHNVDYLKTPSPQELLKIIGDYDGLVVRSATKVSEDVFKSATKLRVVGRAGVGVDNIDIAAATRNGVLVMNTPGGNTVSTAQLAMSLLCSLARHIPAANMSIKQGKWDRKSFTGVEISGKTIGIIGCGRIGQVVASAAHRLGMRVIGYDPVMSQEALKSCGIEPVDLSGIWSHSDFITVHTPLTPETSNLINDETIAKCKNGVRIINCARGGIVDEAALLRGLNSGHVAGAALDVYTSEPPKEYLKALLEHPNLVCTPHLGASTDEAQINVAKDIASQMCDLFDNKDYVGIVNVSYIAAAGQPHMKPFMVLSEKLGAICAQLSPSKVTHVTVKTWGGRDVNIVTPQARDLLRAKVLKGLVRYGGYGLVPDLISAPSMAADVKIASDLSDDPPDINLDTPYWNLVSAEVAREDGSRSSITGAVFGSVPHIVQVDEFTDLFAFKPEGAYLLHFRNEDRPGAISEVLRLLQQGEVNVANVNVSRSQGSKDANGSKLALCFMSLDDNVPTKIMKALHSLPFLSHVSLIQLQ